MSTEQRVAISTPCTHVYVRRKFVFGFLTFLCFLLHELLTHYSHIDINVVFTGFVLCVRNPCMRASSLVLCFRPSCFKTADGMINFMQPYSPSCGRFLKLFSMVLMIPKFFDQMSMTVFERFTPRTTQPVLARACLRLHSF